MKRIIVMVGIVLLAGSFAMAGAPKSYQVTGPVLEFDGDHITVFPSLLAGEGRGSLRMRTA